MVSLSPTLAAGVYFKAFQPSPARLRRIIRSPARAIRRRSDRQQAGADRQHHRGQLGLWCHLAPGAVNFTNLVAERAMSRLPTVATSGNTSGSGNLKAGYTGIQSISASGADAGNYTFAGVTGDYTVTQLALTGTMGPAPRPTVRH
jgi:hypothetical protein